MNTKIAVSIVTYNRLELLKQVVNGVRNQTRKLSQIIVVNNSSTDGTLEWLSTQDDILTMTQANLGGAGGQHLGIKTAYEQGNDWIWIIDDDVVAEPDCLKNLMKNEEETKIIRSPLRLDTENKPFLIDLVKVNMSNPFKSIFKEVLSEEHLKQNEILMETATFEGPVFHRSMVEKIGLPISNFFFYSDDTEYFIRARKAGFIIKIFTDAHLLRKLPYMAELTSSERKLYYGIRNIIALDVLHANFFIRLIRPFGYLLNNLRKVKKLWNIKVIFKGFFDGYFYNK